jgi:nucleotide-binding universal stress UspA family protein
MLGLQPHAPLVPAAGVSEKESAMFKKVLFPTDFSEPADRLLSCLDEWRSLGFKQIVLLHVTDVRHAVDVLGFDSTYYERHDKLAAKS